MLYDMCIDSHRELTWSNASSTFNTKKKTNKKTKQNSYDTDRQNNTNENI